MEHRSPYALGGPHLCQGWSIPSGAASLVVCHCGFSPPEVPGVVYRHGLDFQVGFGCVGQLLT